MVLLNACRPSSECPSGSNMKYPVVLNGIYVDEYDIYRPEASSKLCSVKRCTLSNFFSFSVKSYGVDGKRLDLRLINALCGFFPKSQCCSLQLLLVDPLTVFGPHLSCDVYILRTNSVPIIQLCIVYGLISA
ncbi:hypothetical protein BDV27DRAFT_129212 [Aspergillus caelatus]|uniref:Uncharacterized protein n=1 Tax=Aspergillus caelatus TaxID=61420 RepID=A0A5N7A2D3_9EURO|nr:uncharacterized protein BDV27DRAFT_129212 [Aspergillus caelatus]KAE8363992.1 hypothetical protein BDV27DRAFT_129212 [Aspergillus caelatus]